MKAWVAGFLLLAGLASGQETDFIRGEADDASGEFAPDGVAAGAPLDELEWVVASDDGDVAAQYWAIPTAVGDDAAEDEKIIRNRQPYGTVSVQQVGSGSPGSDAAQQMGVGDSKDAQQIGITIDGYPAEGIAPGGTVGYDGTRVDIGYGQGGYGADDASGQRPSMDSGIPSQGRQFYSGGDFKETAGQDTFRDYKQTSGQPSGDRTVLGVDTQAADPCETDAYGSTCPDPCSVDATNFYCPNDPCILNPGSSPCDDACGTDDRYPGCTNDVCESDPGGSICPDPCVHGTTYQYCSGDPCMSIPPGSGCADPCSESDTYPTCANDVCEKEAGTWKCPDPCTIADTYAGCTNATTQTPVTTTDPDDDAGSAFSPAPAKPLLALLPALLLPFIL